MMGMDWDDLDATITQLTYIDANLQYWRGDTARKTKNMIREAIKNLKKDQREQARRMR